jgi:hypothetical protein
MNFTATLELHGKTATGIEVPEEVVLGLGSSKRPAVVVTINGFSYRTTIAPYNGVYLIPVSAENRAGAQAHAGEVLDVTVEIDTEPRAIEVPADLAKALKADKAAKAFFESLSLSNQRGYVDWITSAKKDETRQARVATSLESLAAGRKAH